MTMHLGYERAGWRGMIAAGASFIIPAALISGLLAWAYVQYGDVPAVEPFLEGIKPAVVVIIAGALYRLGRRAVRTSGHFFLGVCVAAAVVAGVGELTALLAGVLIGTTLTMAPWKSGDGGPSPKWAPIVALGASGAVPVAIGAAAAPFTLWKLAAFFLKVGAVLYGSGYVLIAFMEGGLVDDYGWMTRDELLEAVAVGQLTPGPVLSTSTFIGYVLGGLPGAIIATVCIFLPSFFFVAVLNPIVPRLRAGRWSAAFLDAANVSSVALMAAVTIELSAVIFAGWVPLVIAVVAAVLILRYRVGVAWIVAISAMAGWFGQWIVLWPGS
jgi:chromate transporter